MTPSPTATANGPALTAQVIASADDVNQDASTLTSDLSTVWLGTGSSTASSYAGFRFAGLAIPRGAAITSARLQLYSSQTQWITVSMTMAGEASGNSVAFSAGNLPSQRSLTAQTVTHSSDTQWLANTWYTLDEMAPVIQEITARADWQSGNSLSIILKGTGAASGRKFVVSYDGSMTNAPKLVVSYTLAVP